ncbi:MAG: hypothetical protein NTX50_12320 [Candidatus Sumerlaeota bacterium]|nr:hypothetical protein [Candidatus Sumerlaeota bacterium]
MILPTLIQDVRADVAATANLHNGFSTANTVLHPIPYFGDINNAEIITIGANPSDKEFVARGWPVPPNIPYTNAALANRLRNYFSQEPGPSPRYFNPWIAGLDTIGAAYRPIENRRTAAHLDISPRPTIAMRRCLAEQFIEMGQNDIRWLFRILCNKGISQKIRLIIAAGTFTKRRYIIEFIRDCAPNFNAAIMRRIDRGGILQNRNYLDVDGIQIPIYGISSGPGKSRNFYAAMHAQRNRMRQIVNGAAPVDIGW